MKNKIEFIEGEKFCRYNGVLMTPEKHKDLFGFYGEMEEYEYNNKKYIYLSLYDEENFKEAYNIEAEDIKEAIFLYLQNVSSEEIKSKLKIEEYLDFIDALDFYYNKLS